MQWCLCLCILLFSVCHSGAESLADYTPPYGEKLIPKPFHYEYGAQSAGNNKKETQDEQGNIKGQVVVSLPDGRIQTTNYNAHYYDGYVADVKYEGTPTYPPQQHQNYHAPQFIPVHLKARPAYNKLAAPTKSRFHNFPYRNQETVEETREPVLPPQVKSQRIRFEPERINNIELPEAQRTSTKETSMAEIMAKIREDLKTVKSKKQNSISPEFRVTPEPTQDNMEEIMKKVREDLKNLEKLRVQPTQAPTPTFHNTHTMKEMIEKMRENIASQELPPMMKIKSHVIPKKDKMSEIIMKMKKNKKNKKPEMMSIKSHVVTPMSVMSHVLATPAPAESMAEIMKKIREDLKKTNKVELPPSVMKIKSHVINKEPEVTEDMMEIVQSIRNDLNTDVKLVIEGRDEKITHLIKKKPLKASVVDFMKKIELMKEKENTPAVMSVKSRVIQQTNQDSDGNVSMKILSHVIPENPKRF